MGKLAGAGRIFYGAAITEIGLQTIWYRDVPYMLLPPNHLFPGFVTLAFILGILLTLAGAFIVINKYAGPVSLILGALLLLIFCFYFIPYQFMAASRYLHFEQWENAAKELALGAGAFVIADHFTEKRGNLLNILGRVAPYGIGCYSITIISFGIDHFLYGKDAADYVPAWAPWHVFWIYFTGTALLCAGIAILLNIKRSLAAVLLGLMIFIWFISLHVPRVISSPVTDLDGEMVSAFLALGYCGIALVIA